MAKSKRGAEVRMRHGARTTVLAMVLLGTGATSAVGVATAGPKEESGYVVFVRKQCSGCHRPRGEPAAGPAVERIRHAQGEMELAGGLWNHVPMMFTTLSERGIEWPRITVAEMTDLMAYLGADPARDPAPDLLKGQVMVLRKGCLKCHSLRGEGGRIQPDLAERRADYDSGAAWAATMWAHTPRMADVAARQGVPYPRFSGDEMVNLLGFLRSAAEPARGTGTPRR